MKSLFSELNGFVVYEPSLLHSYLKENHLLERDVLKYFTETDHGELITKKGIAIPIIGVNTGYYHFNVSYEQDSLLLTDGEIRVKSSGWIYYTESGQLCIVGIGYLKNIESIHSQNCLSYQIDKGWYSIDILCGERDGAEEMILELLLKRVNEPPLFRGDFDVEYSF